MRRLAISLLVATVGVAGSLCFLREPLPAGNAASAGGSETTKPAATARIPVVSAAKSPGDTHSTSARPDTATTDSYASIEMKARAGDRSALRTLNHLLGHCAVFNSNPALQKQTIEASSQQLNDAQQARAMRTAGARVEERCRDVARGDPIPPEEILLWLETAASQGDVLAKVGLVERSPTTLPPADFDRFVNDVVAANDPDAMFELSQLMGSPHQQGLAGTTSAMSGDQRWSDAWILASCRLGASSCRSQAVLDLMCLNGSGCTYSTVEEFVTNNVSNADRQVIDRYALQIINQIRL